MWSMNHRRNRNRREEDRWRGCFNFFNRERKGGWHHKLQYRATNRRRLTQMRWRPSARHHLLADPQTTNFSIRKRACPTCSIFEAILHSRWSTLATRQEQTTSKGSIRRRSHMHPQGNSRSTRPSRILSHSTYHFRPHLVALPQQRSRLVPKDMSSVPNLIVF